ncbi:hypothetical protein GDO81_004631 [Engystomops pustulosus]|uniref:Uncharacterized protein n=1 Tax=Engystomops pustulosus TaxID=76066 RepID=A0AAV6ZYM2_ENGPU|nr:hypothetical protein GDO81_004631 [Engystomops pustulosus]
MNETENVKMKDWRWTDIPHLQRHSTVVPCQVLHPVIIPDPFMLYSDPNPSPCRGLRDTASRSSQCSFSTISTTHPSVHTGWASVSHLRLPLIVGDMMGALDHFSLSESCPPRVCWTRHPLVQKNKKVVLSSFLLLLLGLVFVFVGVGLQVSPSPAVSSAIFFVPGLLLLIPGGENVPFTLSFTTLELHSLSGFQQVMSCMYTVTAPAE